MSHIKDLQLFIPLHRGSKDTYNHTIIPLHMCFDVNFFLMRNLRLVSGGNMTGDRDNDSYFGVVKMDTLRTDLFLEKLNGIEVAATDIVNAYIHGFTNEYI